MFTKRKPTIPPGGATGPPAQTQARAQEVIASIDTSFFAAEEELVEEEPAVGTRKRGDSFVHDLKPHLDLTTEEKQQVTD
jgi:hypothetical protein